MNKGFILFVLFSIVIAGCAKQEATQVVNKKARKYLIEGTVFLKQGEARKAAESFATAIKMDPNDFEGYFMLGEMFLRLKQYPQAGSVMTAAIRQFPDSGLAHYLLATSLEGMGQLVPAIVSARRSVELFNAKGDKEGTQRALILLGALISAAKEASEAQMVANSSQDAVKAVEENTVPVNVLESVK
ncbi:MAG: tetratricopeptide repeat protein [Candidatus Omnitrophica bacterium]|nr:tetratricopeptide repeat protein [Candidatus Omnitrophota bacterium]